MDKLTQQMVMASGKLDKERQYWMSAMDGVSAMSCFPADLPRTLPASDCLRYTHTLSQELSGRILTVSNKSEVALLLLLTSGVGYLAGRYGTSPDAVIATPVLKEGAGSGQGHRLLNRLVPVRVPMDEEQTFREWLAAVKTSATGAQEHPNLPFELLCGELGIPAEAPIMVMLEPIQDRSSCSQVQVETLFRFFRQEERLCLEVEYREGRYSEAMIAQLCAHLERFLLQALHKPDIRLKDVELLSHEEQRQQLEEFNLTSADYPREATIHALFSAMAETYPDRTAVSMEGQELAYRELDERSNRLARLLRDKGVKPDHTVALLLDRSPEMVISILAVLKAGGAYVPVDPEYPEDRIAFMLEDCGAQLVLTVEGLAPLAGSLPAELLCLDAPLLCRLMLEGDGSPLPSVSCPSDMAYIIYTSGTTGKPKGVMIEHRQVVRLMVNDRFAFDFNEQDVWTVFHSFCFDFSVWEMYGALLYGGRLVIVPRETARNPRAFRELLIRERVTVLNQTPSAFYTLIHEECRDGEEAGLAVRYVIFGGEALSPLMLAPWRSRYPGTRLINMYGITETTVHVTYKPITDREIETNISNIGKPIPTLTAYIFDSVRRLVPIGVTGELYVGGDGVGRGYLNREELTAERFVDNPYKPGERLYRSGDLARLLHNGEMEYYGRMDHQVKIRGHRIELGEIETRLLKLQHVREAVVLALDEENGGGKYLAAYLVSEEPMLLSDLRSHLGAELPDYMIPSHFVQLEAMPLTSNGKVDRRRLPKPDLALVTREEYAAPRNALEERLANVWSRVLGTGPVGLKDHFFALGGHSLKGMALLSAVHQEFGVEFPLSVLFEAPTLEGMAQALAELEAEGFSNIAPAPAAEHYPVSPAQRRMYLVHQLAESGTGYNMPGFFLLKGEWNTDALETVLRKLLSRHEALRTSFLQVDGEPVQKVWKESQVPFFLEVWRAPTGEPGENLEEAIRRKAVEFVRPFDVAAAPLFRAGLMPLADGRAVLMLDMHHIVSDGVSMSILVQEFGKLVRGEELETPALQYKDYAVWQNRRLADGELDRQESYWLEAMKGELPVLELPADQPRPLEKSYAGAYAALPANRELMQSLEKLQTETGTTLYMVLMAVYQILLAKYSGQTDVIVGTPSAGRSHADTAGMVGMFVGTLAIRGRPEGEKSFLAFLEEMKQTTLEALSNQDYPFELLVDKLGLRRDLGRHPLFDTMFMLQNIDVEEVGETATSSGGTLEIQTLETPHATSKFDLTLDVRITEEGLVAGAEYCTALYTEDTVTRLLQHFLQLAEQAAHTPEAAIRELDMVSREEKTLLLEQFNDTRVDYPSDASLSEMFQEQADRNPLATALVHGGAGSSRAFTYAELDRMSDLLACRIRNHFAPETVKNVGLMTLHSPEWIVGVLAILKAGGAFVPLDPSFPEERLAYMLEDSEARLVLAEEATLETAETVSGQRPMQIMLLETSKEDGSDTASASASELVGFTKPAGWDSSRALAYIMYTSGSTGKPKGVMVTHRNVIRLVKNSRFLPWSEATRILQTGAIGFDAVTFEIFGALLNGGALYLADKETILDPAALEERVREQEITTMWLTSPLFNQLSQDRPDMFRTLKHLLVGGDALSPKHIRAVREACPKLLLLNGYGPTENTTFSTVYPITRDHGHNIPIGGPITNSTAYILNPHGQLQPVGVPGELYVGGDGVALGYVKLPELTAERFVPDPFHPARKAVMYRTGDRARWLPDGTIEYLGRMDLQVKIRGYRIETSEIEAVMLGLEGLKEAVVTVYTDSSGSKQLAAYYTTETGASVPEVRTRLAAMLPDYMVPASCLRLDRMPLTANGKVDRRALPEPEPILAAAGTYTAPQTRLEEELAEIWQEVLGVDRIGVHDDFFALGGHSLKAMSLLSAIHKRLYVQLPMKELFAAPTLSRLALRIEGSSQAAFDSIPPAELREAYPLSAAQKRMYVLDRLEDGLGTAYNMPGVMILSGPLDVERFESAFGKLIRRHESLRTSFHMEEGEPCQRIHDDVRFDIERGELNGALDGAIPDRIAAFVRPFNLSKAPLLRVGLDRLGEDRHLFLLDMHHIISDGVSLSLLIEEFTALYRGEEALPELRIQYKDFAVWQNGVFQSGKLRTQETYWLETFADGVPVLELSYDFPRPAAQSFEGDYILFRIESELSEALTKLAAEAGATLYMVLLAAYNVLLSRYSGQEDIVVGTPVAGRSHGDTERLLGLFVNTLAMRNYPRGDRTFLDFLHEVKERTLDAFEHQDYPFEELVEKLGIPRDLSRNPLFDTMFSVLNVAPPASEELQELSIEPYGAESKVAKFDLSLEATEEEAGIRFNLEFCTRLFLRETAERMGGHYIQLLRAIAADPSASLAELSLLTPQEEEELLYGFNRTATDFDYSLTVPQLFEQQAIRTPDRIAASCGDAAWTYRELNERSNRLARHLVAHGLHREELAAILMDRSLDMLACILAVWKAGGAYVPVDPSYPEQRIRDMVAGAGAACLLTMQRYAGETLLEGYEGAVIPLDAHDGEIAAYECTNLELPVESGQRAYVIFTSGSTGKPKGAVLEHAGMWNHIEGMLRTLDIGEDCVIAQNAPHCFDISVWQFVTALTVGGQTAIYPNELVLEPRRFMEKVAEEGVTVLEAVVSFLGAVLEQPSPVELPALRHLIVTGESVKPQLAQRWFEVYPGVKLVNAYGPTEAADDITLHIMDRAPDTGLVPIGKPLQNLHVYVVDGRMQPVPIGVKGELCVSGIGVGRGYLNDPERTARVFLEDPFIGSPGVRLYRTGDLARWLPDGNLEYIGRMDHQVKIRGHRIECGEIEVRLQECEYVKEAVVIDRSDRNGQKYLAAYFLSDSQVSVEELREELLKSLPPYMVPDHMMQMEQFPLTPNGKIDRKALPEPAAAAEGRTRVYTSPAGELEHQLAELWQQVLGVEQVGALDHFFEMGGHSLRAMILLARIHKHLGVELPLRTLFEVPVLRDLAKVIRTADRTTASEDERSIVPADEREYYPVSSAQRRMLILNQLTEGDVTYNMPEALEAEGELDAQRLEQAFLRLIERHEALRTSFTIADGEPVQIIHGVEDVTFRLEQVDCRDREAAARAVEAFIRPFDLTRAPLFRATLIRLEDGGQVLAYDLHHIIADGVSTGILVYDLVRLYEGEELPPLCIQYKDYAVWQNGFLESDGFTRQEQYWLDAFREPSPVLELPMDLPRPAVKSFKGDYYGFRAETALTDALNRLAAETNTTLYMLLLSAYNVLLAQYSGQDDIVVGTPIAGRTHAELQSVAGMFVGTLPMRNHPKGSLRFREFLEQVKRSTLLAFENQEYPFEQLVEKLDLTRDLSRNPLFDTMFIVQNADDTEAEVQGVQLKPFQGYGFQVAKFDLTLIATMLEGEIAFTLEYGTDLFHEASMRKLAERFLLLLRRLASQPDMRIGELSLLTSEEEQLLLREWSGDNGEPAASEASTREPYTTAATLHGLFEEQAKMSPEQTALILGTRRMTYGELNRRADLLTAALRERGAGPGHIVGIMLDRSFEMAISAIAVLKSGSAYVPIDPAYPEERILHILSDSGVRIVATQSEYGGMLKELSGSLEQPLQLLDVTDPVAYSAEIYGLSTWEPTAAQPEDLAYIIYTSGTTGLPKGVMVEHRSIAHNLAWRRKEYGLGAQDTVLQLFSFAFDGFITSFFTPMAAGSTVLLADHEESRNPVSIARHIQAHGVTHFISLPSLYDAVLEVLEPESAQTLRIVTLAGEKVSNAVIARSRSKLAHVELVNEYGPTENSVVATFKRGLEPGLPAVIGRPIEGTSVFIVNAELVPVPPGVPGELCLAGAGLARGYRNLPELTEAKFVANPPQPLPVPRLYRTGDRVRWTTDGQIEFIGRTDEQVKIRGYRIEPGEIEGAMTAHPSIREAAVIVDGAPGQERLLAYFTAEAPLEPEAVRDHLQRRLPAYMLPSGILPLERMPRTPNGKLDRRALPKLEASDMTAARPEYTEPRDDWERLVAKAMEYVLDVESIGIHDHFFDLGGHSLKAAALIARLYEHHGIEMSIRDVFLSPVVEQLAEAVKRKQIKSDLEAGAQALNRALAGPIVFCFPPVSGYGAIFRQMAGHWTKVRAYGLDFYEQEDRIDRIIADIMTVDQSGPYTFIGYSAGGNLAFEVAKAMEQQGYVVKRIFMLDSSRKTKIIKQSMEKIAQEVEQELRAAVKIYKDYLSDEAVLRMVGEKMKSYIHYLHGLINDGTVSADIHMIEEKALLSLSLSDSIKWHKSTSGRYARHQGFGAHERMLEGEFALRNAKLIEELIHGGVPVSH